MESPKLLIDRRSQNAEGPLWHTIEQRLYWTDIPAGQLFRYDPTTQAHEQIYDGESVGGFTVQSDGSLLLFKSRGTIERWQDGQMKTVGKCRGLCLVGSLGWWAFISLCP